MANVYKQYARETLEGEELAGEYISIVDSGEVSDEAIESVKQIVAELAPQHKIICSRAGCTISSHCGPGTLGVMFLRK